MAEEQDSAAEKSQEPTPKRLEKAREQGDMARSRELNTAAVLLTGAGGMILFGGYMGEVIGEVMRHNFVLERAHIFDTSTMFSALGASAMAGFRSLLPLFAMLLVAAFLGPMALSGWNFSAQAIAPKLSRMSPLSGIKRMFGARALMELFKALAKVIVVAAIALVILHVNTNTILGMQHEPTVAAIAHALSVIAWSVLAMACAMILITMVDIPFQIHHHQQKLRMTQQQVKDERKDTDGNPEVKQRVRQLQQEMSQNRMMEEVPDADVVITNPEHYAVALRYRDGLESAPIMLAKGCDYMALRIRELARSHSIPVVQAPALARAIYFHTELGDEIPAGLYMAVAQVLAYVYQLKQYEEGTLGQPPQLAEELPIPPDLHPD